MKILVKIFSPTENYAIIGNKRINITSKVRLLRRYIKNRLANSIQSISTSGNADVFSHEIHIPHWTIHVNIDSKNDIPESDLDRYFEIFTDTSEIIYQVWLALNIQFPGLVSIKWIALVDKTNIYGDEEKLESYHSFHRLEDTLQYKWPASHRISTNSALLWLNNVSNGSHDQMTRVLGAYKKALLSQQDIDALLWSVIGLEALYCDASDGIKRQILQRSQIMHGPITEFKKQISSFYDTRSKLLHGSMSYDIVLDDNEFEHIEVKEIRNSCNIALRMLASGIQWCIKNKKLELRYIQSIA